MPDVVITQYTDPACPWAYSAEPFRRRIAWLYGDAVEWQSRMVVLADSVEQYEGSGFTPERLSAAYDQMAREYGMPIDTGLRPRMAATLPACTAVIAARLHTRPGAEDAVLRFLRVRTFAGELLDAPETIAGAAHDAGLDPAALAGWMAGEDVATALAADMAEARAPSGPALALDHKLAGWSGGRRYTCPSYEFAAGATTISAPGFQPMAVYDVALANLLPHAQRRETPTDVAEVLRWAGEPLASKEVAVVCEIDVPTAREALGRVASERHIGSDGLWSLN